MKGVIEYDRQEREGRQRLEQKEHDDLGHESVDATVAELKTTEGNMPTAASRPPLTASTKDHETSFSEEEYEEVEVTDDEVNENLSKRQKIEGDAAEEPIEFNEDDIAHQLEVMGQDYGLDPGEYGGGEQGSLEEGAEGLPLTEADSIALFKDMLNYYHINPYTTWEALIEDGQIIEDDRYTVLPTTRARKDVWSEWSRDTIQRLKEQREKEEKTNPKIPYFAFLQTRATPKLYWPEFRRKYQKEPEMRNTKLTDKDREKWYREYIGRLKLPERILKADLIKLLKSIPLDSLNRSTTLGTLPSALLTELRFVSLRASIRDPLIEAHISSLPPAPTDLDVSSEETAQANEKQERDRRDQALADRQRQVQEEKRRQQGALRHSKGMLREGEQEIERAMKVGRDALLGHKDTDKTEIAQVLHV